MTPEIETTMQDMVRVMVGVEERRRTAQVMETAARLFPYLAQDFTQEAMPLAVGSAITPTDRCRIVAAVEAAWRIQELVEERVKLRMETDKGAADQFKPDDRPRDKFSI
jgi:hypothetical protein